MKKTLILAVFLIAATLVGCGTNSSQNSPAPAIQTALDAQVALFDIGASDAETAGGVTVLQSSTESYCWYRHFGSPSIPSYSIISQDNVNALVKVTRSVEGTLYYHLAAGSTKRLKYFSQDFTSYAKLTSADGGTSWSVAQLSTAVDKSTKQTPTLGVGSVPCDVTISRVVLSAAGSVIADVTVEATSNGPWLDLSALPKVQRGSTLEVTVYASVASGKPLVFIWPSLKTVFRAPLNDDAVSGVFSNAADFLTVSSTETTGIKYLYIGAFSSATLSDVSSPYDFGGWHLLYRVE